MRWIKSSDRLPEPTHKHGEPPELIIMRRIFPEGYKRIHSLTANQIKDYTKHNGQVVDHWNCSQLDWEWLDETEYTSDEKDLIIYGLEEGSKNWQHEYDSCRGILIEMIFTIEDRPAFAQTVAFAKEFLSKYQHQ